MQNKEFEKSKAESSFLKSNFREQEDVVRTICICNKSLTLRSGWGGIVSHISHDRDLIEPGSHLNK